MLYPPLAPYRSGLLAVGDGHHVYWEESGNPTGLPVVVLHGGPGAGCTDISRRWFDPRRCRIVTFDQRGCGRSTPHASVEHNTTQHLVADLETLRTTLNIARWVLFGRSWGATLALAYAERHAERVGAMILNAVFTARRRELDWLYRGGAAHLFPDAWADFIALATADQALTIESYYAQLQSEDAATAARAARAWCAWEDSVGRVPAIANACRATTLARARISAHYFVRRAFLREGELLDNAHCLSGIRAAIVQGADDLVTPAGTARVLHERWPTSRLDVVPDAGHASGDPAIMRALIAATDRICNCS